MLHTSQCQQINDVCSRLSQDSGEEPMIPEIASILVVELGRDAGSVYSIYRPTHGGQ